VPADVLVTALKPSDDGKGLIVRLFNAGAKPAEAKLAWGRKAPRHLWQSDTGERPVLKLSPRDTVMLPACGVVALRVEFSYGW